MYCDLCVVYRQNEMKKYINEFVAIYAICKKAKVEHHNLRVLSHDISIPTWNWEDLNMDFIIGLPYTRLQHYSIWFVVDRMMYKLNSFHSRQGFLSRGRLCQENGQCNTPKVKNVIQILT